LSAVDGWHDFRTYDLVAVHFRLLGYAINMPMSSGEILRPARRCGGKARGFQEETVSGNRTAARQTGCLLDRRGQRRSATRKTA
jgi:hypothetical protein